MRFSIVLLQIAVAMAFWEEAVEVRGQAVENYYFNTFAGQSSPLIPDGNASGISDTRSISGSAITSISKIKVTLDLSGETSNGANIGFNGDLYAYIRHDSGFSVLLNRPGRTSGNLAGYSDGGLNVVFEAGGANGDIHNYGTLPSNGSIWEPDARATDPSSVLDTDARTAGLDSFQGLGADGTWTLYLADLDSGGLTRIDGWGVEITPVPEPRGILLATGVVMGVFAGFRRLKRKSKDPCHSGGR